MINDFRDWIEDLWDRACDVGATLWELVKAIWFLVAHIIYDPIEWLYIKTNNFFWYKIASRRMIYKWIKKNIVSGKAKNELILKCFTYNLVRKNKLTEEQSSELKRLFSEKNPKAECIFKIPKDTFDF